MSNVVSYIRVSTARQGASGLGLEAQRAAVTGFCDGNGATVLREFREVESGKNNARPVLAEAIAYARKHRAVLLIAKLDRLARNVHFISGLMESNVEFRAVDVPQANRLLLHIMAAVAEAEAKAISDRTIAALAAAKARGKALGAMNPRSRNLTPDAVQRGAQQSVKVRSAAATAFYADVEPTIRELRDSGKSLAEIVLALNEAGHALRSSKPWNAMQVRCVLQRSA